MSHKILNRLFEFPKTDPDWRNILKREIVKSYWLNSLKFWNPEILLVELFEILKFWNLIGWIFWNFEICNVIGWNCWNSESLNLIGWNFWYFEILKTFLVEIFEILKSWNIIGWTFLIFWNCTTWLAELTFDVISFKNWSCDRL